MVNAAGYKFVNRLISAAYEGKTGVVEPSYVYTKGNSALAAEIGEELDFFSVPVELGVSLLPPSSSSPPLTNSGLPNPTAQRYREGSPDRQALRLREDAPQGCPPRALGLHRQCVLSCPSLSLGRRSVS